MQLVTTTDADCPGAGFCDFGWSEGIIYMHGTRLEVDLSSLAGIDSVVAYFWVTMENDARKFLSNTGGVVDQDAGTFYDDALWVYGGGQPMTSLAVSACEAELYEIYIYASEGFAGVETVLAADTALLSCYPNPLNPATTISYRLTDAMPVQLGIHDAAGRRVRTLVSGELVGVGDHMVSWDGRDDTGCTLGSGVYFAHLATPRGVANQRLVLLK
ncbi:MAG: FlgD immunoglobulin-like domain containing protein [bacterium]